MKFTAIVSMYVAYGEEPTQQFYRIEALTKELALVKMKLFCKECEDDNEDCQGTYLLSLIDGWHEDHAEPDRHYYTI